MYLIFPCSSCGKPAVSKEGQKTKVCPFCGAKTRLAEVKQLGKISSPREAKELVSRLKIQNFYLKRKTVGNRRCGGVPEN